MLYPGIKLGPKDWREKLDLSNTNFAEIWFRVDKLSWYDDMFATLKERGVAFGLHFWALTSSNHEPNITYPGDNWHESLELMQKCLEIAHQTEAVYVNIHSGNRCLFNIDFDSQELSRDQNYPLAEDLEAQELGEKALNHLSFVAKSSDTQLLVEAIPGKTVVGNWYDHRSTHTDRLYPTNLEYVYRACQTTGIGFTNDFCHTFSMDFDKTREVLYKEFMKKTLLFAPFTKLIHVNTLTEPYNGTDAHGGILPNELKDPTVFPTKPEFIDLLKLITKNQSPPANLWLVGEPKDEHVGNYEELKKIISAL